MGFPHGRPREELLLEFPSSGTYYAELQRPSGSLLENVGADFRDLSIFIEFRCANPPGATTALLDLSTTATYVGIAVYLTAAGEIALYNISSNPAQRIDIATSAVLCDGDVHRVVFTRDDSGTAGGLAVYVDSASAAASTNPYSNTLLSTKISTAALRLGAINAGLNANDLEIGAVGIWDDAILSSSEIERLMGDPRYWLTRIQESKRAFAVDWTDAHPGSAKEGYRAYRDLDQRPLFLRPGMAFTRAEGARARNGTYLGSRGHAIGMLGTLNVAADEITPGGTVYPSQGLSAIGTVGYVSSVTKVGRYSDLTFATETHTKTLIGDPALPGSLNHVGGLTPDVGRNEVLAIVSEANQQPGAVAILNGDTLAIEDVIDTSSLGLTNQDGILYDPDGPYLYIGSSNYITRYDYDRATPALSNPVSWWLGGGVGAGGLSIGAIQGMWQLADKSIVLSVISTNMATFPGLVQIKEPVEGEYLLRLTWFPTGKSTLEHDEGLFVIEDSTTASGYRLYISDARVATPIRVLDPLGLPAP